MIFNESGLSYHTPGSRKPGLAPRRGKKRAIIAVARTILQAAWHVLKEEAEYKELGGDHFDRLNEEKTKSYLVKRLKKLGYEVELKPKRQAA